ncbi:hypothetical protein LUZ60_009471 [Juncus effusus]|nr:hypothetical protein LUZ60_009471 [Juncus effusus]
MGVFSSLLREKGFQAMDKITIDQVYGRYFTRNEVVQFEEFHVAFIDLCKDFTALVPGNFYTVPPLDAIEEFYEKWNDLKEEREQKESFCKFMNKNICTSRTNQNATLVAGLVAPTAALVVKKTLRNTPLLNIIIPLHLIPTCIFVPSCTILSLVGVRMIHLNKGKKL